MIQVLATNITSPIGLTTEENYQVVRSGGSALTPYTQWRGIGEPFAASVFTDEQDAALAQEGFSRFEAMVLHSVADALAKAGELPKERTVFVLSTTKCNVEELGDEAEADAAYLHPGETARKVALHFGITTDPLVVSNACISGVSAQLIAQRLIESGLYDAAIVCGADSVTPFIVAGFQSFKALSPYPCRPFDIERLGLNTGEAAATIIFGRAETAASGWQLMAGCTNNDAYHLSAPSPVGEGSYRAIEQTCRGIDKEALATICVHGTATMFNDQMESKAIQQAGLSGIPLTAFKGYFGHTMGASGVLETVLTMRALDDGCILPVRGFEEIGVSGKVTISNQELQTDKQRFLKIISGFGGCNGALYFNKVQGEEPQTGETTWQTEAQPQLADYQVTHRVHITPAGLEIDGQRQATTAQGKALLTEIYKQSIGNYPKFYKMDLLCRLAFVASELLLQQEANATAADLATASEREGCGEERGVIFFNRTSSIDSDRKHIATIVNKELPSPSIFLYTLPNIMTGEIAIKHGYKGETSLYILDHKNEEQIRQVVAVTLQQSNLQSVVTGWVDGLDDEHFEADVFLACR